MKLYDQVAKQQGVPPDTIREIVLSLAYYGGHPYPVAKVLTDEIGKVGIRPVKVSK